MFTFESKLVVFQGQLQCSPERIDVPSGQMDSPDERHEKPTRYWTLAQSSVDLKTPENSPSVSMWAYLLATDQTKRLNEISVYVEHGKSAEAIRFLYLNDFALSLWRQMEKPIKVVGRLHRPPRAAILSFGMPFSE